MPSAIGREAASLIAHERWAALATLDEGRPTVSMVAYAVEGSLDALVIFVSGLAAHTRHLVETPSASLAISAQDTGEGDPQLLPRVTLRVAATELPRGSDDFATSAVAYVRRFPDALPRFELADFRLFRFVIEDARYVGGFGRAASLEGHALREAAAESAGGTAAEPDGEAAAESAGEDSSR